MGLDADSPTGELQTPSSVSDPAGVAPGTWKVSVDLAHVPRAARAGAPELIAAVLRRHEACPAALGVTYPGPADDDPYRPAPRPDGDPAPDQSPLFRL